MRTIELEWVVRASHPIGWPRGTHAGGDTVLGREAIRDRSTETTPDDTRPPVHTPGPVRSASKPTHRPGRFLRDVGRNLSSGRSRCCRTDTPERNARIRQRRHRTRDGSLTNGLYSITDDVCQDISWRVARSGACRVLRRGGHKAVRGCRDRPPTPPNACIRRGPPGSPRAVGR